MTTKVTLRQKKISKGRQSLYLDFYPAIPHPETGEPTRREFLGLYLFENIKNPIDKQHNTETLKIYWYIGQFHSCKSTREMSQSGARRIHCQKSCPKKERERMKILCLTKKPVTSLNTASCWDTQGSKKSGIDQQQTNVGGKHRV